MGSAARAEAKFQYLSVYLMRISYGTICVCIYIYTHIYIYIYKYIYIFIYVHIYHVTDVYLYIKI
jgi:hypothetical protein